MQHVYWTSSYDKKRSKGFTVIDRKRARSAFDTYVKKYDPSNPRIALKIDHTLRVAELCECIASANELDPDLAWLCGLLHDIGRFEQVRRFDTFNDAGSVPHAALGVEVLFGNADPHGPQIRSFVDEGEDDLLRTAIATHSSYRLPTNLDDRTRAYCNVLRDADKVDIIKVNCVCPIEDIYGVSKNDMESSAISPEVEAIFYEHRTIPRGIRTFPADILVGHLCFAWELVFPISRQILMEQGHLEQMLSRHFLDPATQQTFEAMAHHMRTWLFGEESTHMDERLQRQLSFALELDKEKNILRQTHLSGHGRRENDAEHAWHMAIISWLMREYANEPIDIARVMLMCLIHDVVEIDAGDTYAYDEAALKTQAAREEAAKQRIFGLLPDDQATELMALFEEFEAYQTPESKFAHAMDNLQPVLLNSSNEGSDWREHGVNANQVYGRQRKTALGSERLFADVIAPIIEEHISRGNIKG